MGCILTMDVGTTAIKTCLFDDHLSLLCSASAEYSLITQAGGIVEKEPLQYWDAVKESIRTLLSDCRHGDRIAAVTVTTQGETLIPVDSGGNALRQAIVWLDNRAGSEAAIIAARFGPEKIYPITGMPEINGACPVAKVLWIKNHEPDVFAKTCKFLLLEDYIIMKLTGKFVTERSLLTSTGYYDISADRYWHEILDAIGVPEEMFPDDLECGRPVGMILPEIAAELGISQQAVVTTGAMDQVAAAIGAGNTGESMITETTGTALVIMATTTKPDFGNPARITVYRHAEKGKYLLVPVCMTAGIILKWFKDEFCSDEIQRAAEANRDVYDLLCDMAGAVPPLSGGLLFLPYFSGNITTDNCLGAKGVLFGLGLDTKKNQVIRAILESVAFLLREHINLVESAGVAVSEVRSLGGGSRSGLWQQIKADVCGKAFSTMDFPECASLGAAILGAVGIGLFDSISGASAAVSNIKDRFEPASGLAGIYSGGYDRFRQLYQAIRPLYE